MAYYNDPFILLPPSNVLNQFYLSIDNTNRLVEPLPIIKGANNKPAISFQYDERTGLYWHGLGIFGFASLGFTAMTVTTGEFSLWNKDFSSIKFQIDTLTPTGDFTHKIQNKNGTIALLEDLDRTKYFHYWFQTVDTETEFSFSGFTVYPNTCSCNINGITQINERQVVFTDTGFEIQHDMNPGSFIEIRGLKQ